MNVRPERRDLLLGEVPGEDADELTSSLGEVRIAVKSRHHLQSQGKEMWRLVISGEMTVGEHSKNDASSRKGVGDESPAITHP